MPATRDGRGRTALVLSLALTATFVNGGGADASSADAASRDPQGRGLQLLAEREAIVARQTRLAAQSARARGLALYRLVLAAKAERRSPDGDGGRERPGGRALSIGAAVLSRDLREARLFQGELERVRDERRRVAAFSVATASSQPDSGGSSRGPTVRLLPPVAGRLINGFGVARDEATRSWLFRTTAAFAARANEPVRAGADGRVVTVAEDVGGGSAVVIAHEQGLRTIVSGLGTVTVSEGAVVRRGAALGTAPPLPSLVRIEIWRGRQTVDPAALLANPASRQGHMP